MGVRAPTTAAVVLVRGISWYSRWFVISPLDGQDAGADSDSGCQRKFLAGAIDRYPYRLSVVIDVPESPTPFSSSVPVQTEHIIWFSLFLLISLSCDMDRTRRPDDSNVAFGSSFPPLPLASAWEISARARLRPEVV